MGVLLTDEMIDTQRQRMLVEKLQRLNARTPAEALTEEAAEAQSTTECDCGKPAETVVDMRNGELAYMCAEHARMLLDNTGFIVDFKATRELRKGW